MSEPKDPAIKLFGKMIPLPEKSPKVAAADFCATCGDDNTNNDNTEHSCSTNSSPEENKGEEKEAEKVGKNFFSFWEFWGIPIV